MMLILIFTLIGFVASKGVKWDGPISQPLESRIVGGQEAVPHSLPYQAFLINSVQYYCGGSLISQTVVLTSTRCVQGAYVIVVLGAHRPFDNEPTQVRINTTNIKIHEDYDPLTRINDIALVILPNPVQLNNYIQVVPLAPANAGSYAGSIGRMSGWGRISGSSWYISEVLNYVDIEIMSNQDCANIFYNIVDTSLCTSGQSLTGACDGDYGGPLVVNGVQVAVVSFALIFCNQGLPTVCSRVSEYLDWIADNSV